MKLNQFYPNIQNLPKNVALLDIWNLLHKFEAPYLPADIECGHCAGLVHMRDTHVFFNLKKIKLKKKGLNYFSLIFSIILVYKNL